MGMLFGCTYHATISFLIFFCLELIRNVFGYEAVAESESDRSRLIPALSEPVAPFGGTLPRILFAIHSHIRRIRSPSMVYVIPGRYEILVLYDLHVL